MRDVQVAQEVPTQEETMTDPVIPSTPPITWSMIGLDPNFSLEEQKAKEERKARRSYVCKCGHMARCHSSESDDPSIIDFHNAGGRKCSPGRQRCKCKTFQPVVWSADVRRFMAKSEGQGNDHALRKGMAKSLDAGVEFRYLDGVMCDGGCGRGPLQVELIPLILSLDYHEVLNPDSSSYVELKNVLMCQECRIILRDSHLREAPPEV